MSPTGSLRFLISAQPPVSTPSIVFAPTSTRACSNCFFQKHGKLQSCWLACSSGLAGVFEVGLEHEMAKQAFVNGIEELPDIFLPVADDRQRFSGMRVVVVDGLDEIRVVVADLDVVFSRNESAFHEPGFVFWTRHEAQGVR